MTKLEKALENMEEVKRIIMEKSCPSEFGLEDCECILDRWCSRCCEECWNEEVRK